MNKLALLALCLAVPMCMAQTVTSTAPAPLFTPSSQAVGISLGGQWSVGNLTTETLNITRTCGIEGNELLAPGLNLQGYYGGVACTPDFSALLSKTLLPSQAIQFTFRGSGGFVLNSAASTKNASVLAGGCVTYNVSQNGGIAVPTCFDYVYAPGFGSKSGGFAVSAGLAFVFGH